MTTAETVSDAVASGHFSIGGDTPVVRLGFGAMQLTGPGVWGEPADRAECVRVVRRAVELGVTLIDTADSYGPFVSEQIIREALHPYPEGVVVATKAGFTRAGPNDWRAVGRPEYLRQQCELSLRHLGLERIELLQLHRIDPKVPLEDQLGELRLLRDEGKVHHVGLSEVSVDEIERSRAIVEIVSVQNLYNLTNRKSEAVLDYAEVNGIAFIPWYPLAKGTLAEPGGPLDVLASRHGATPAQLTLAWLLRRSPVMLPIPGTSKVGHLEENIGAAGVRLDDDEFAALSAASTKG